MAGLAILFVYHSDGVPQRLTAAHSLCQIVDKSEMWISRFSRIGSQITHAGFVIRPCCTKTESRREFLNTSTLVMDF